MESWSSYRKVIQIHFKICIALHSYPLFEIFENYIYMKTAKLPQFEASKVDESNLGHTKNEWGTQDTPKIRIMEMYDLKWNVDKKMRN